jgi:hypothetical protein
MTALMMFSYVLPIVVALVAGVVGAGLTAWWLRPPGPVTELVTTEPESDQFINAEIDLAAVQWAEANRQPPEAAGLMAARLKTLHDIGKGKGWI